MILWNRTLARAEKALQGLNTQVAALQLDWDALESTVSAGDVIVSMLPGSLHSKVANLCLVHKAHFISSSYISPEMQALHEKAVAEKLSFVNEVGLDPGIDHLLAHLLVHDYMNSPEYNQANKHYFRSYCGGFPKIPNDFTYKFSWSPLGVLKALTSEARWIDHGTENSITKPWKAVTDYTARTADGTKETFQAYPNRNSLPFMREYGIGEDWNVQEFVRGTLRLSGWTSAWQYLFNEIESMEGATDEQRLTELSNDLWNKYAYRRGEQDRVVLCVELEVHDAETDSVIWHKSYDIDEAGKSDGSAMARLVSRTVSLAVGSLLRGELPEGVSSTPKNPAITNRWLDELRSMGETVPLHNRLFE